MSSRAISAIMAAPLALFLALPAIGAPAPSDPAYWVTYQVDASLRKLPATNWTHWYSAPFSINVGYGLGVIFTDQTITDPSQPNCFNFTFTPKTSNGLLSLRQEITVTEYRGDSLCSPLDPSQQPLPSAVIDMTVEQKQSNTFQLPFFEGQQIQINLSQSWTTQ